MSNFLATYFNSKYLLEAVSGTNYEKYYLYVSLTVLVSVILFRIYISIKKNRPDAYRFFDKLWFWSYLSLGLFGVFIWFSRSQLLPLFSTRLVSYAWILSNLGLLGYLVYYFLKIIPGKLTTFYEKKRKSKYLK